MTKILTTTPEGTEGFNISYLSEQEAGKKLLKVLPKGWKVKFSWCQVLFSDVQYEIDEKEKTVDIAYLQNLSLWWPEVVKEIVAKLAEKK